MSFRIVSCLVLLAVGSVPTPVAAQSATAAAELAVLVPFAGAVERRTLSVEEATSAADGVVATVEILVRANSAWRLEVAAPVGSTLRLVSGGGAVAPDGATGATRSGSPVLPVGGEASESATGAEVDGPPGGPFRVLLEWRGDDTSALAALEAALRSRD